MQNAKQTIKLLFCFFNGDKIFSDLKKNNSVSQWESIFPEFFIPEQAQG